MRPQSQVGVHNFKVHPPPTHVYRRDAVQIMLFG